MYTIPLRSVAEPGLIELTLVPKTSGTLSITFLLPASRSRIFLSTKLGSIPANSHFIMYVMSKMKMLLFICNIMCVCRRTGLVSRYGSGNLF